MHHHKTYKYINFLQIGFLDQSKSCINLQLQILIFKNRLFETCGIGKRTRMSYFRKLGLVDRSVKTVHTNLFAKMASCINYQQ